METIAKIAVTICLLVVVGCTQQAGPQRLTAEGKVLLDGSPVSNATIIFSPQGGGDGAVKAVAKIVDGEFKFTREDGPTVGQFDVQIVADGAEFEAVAEQMLARERVAIKQVQIPKIYSKPGALEASVLDEGPNQYSFELDSKPRRR